MECPAGTVMSRLYRGRRMLQKLLGDYAAKDDSNETADEAGSEEADKLVDFESFRRKKQEGGVA